MFHLIQNISQMLVQKKKDCFKERVNPLNNLEEDVVSISNDDSEAYSIINNYEILNEKM